MGIFVASVAFSTYTYFDYSDKKDTYDGLGLGTSQSTFDSKYEEYQDSSDMLTYSLIGVGAIYILNWVDLLLFSTPDFDGTEKSSARAGTNYLDFDYVGPFMNKQPGVSSILQFNPTSATGKEHYYRLGVGYRF
jgi:hypothetical protein